LGTAEKIFLSRRAASQDAIKNDSFFKENKPGFHALQDRVKMGVRVEKQASSPFLLDALRFEFSLCVLCAPVVNFCPEIRLAGLSPMGV
jgi:hypothetical protein